MQTHKPVLLTSTVSRMRLKPAGSYADCTAGSGGHAQAILEGLNREGRLLAVDRDPDALERCRARLHPWADQCTLVHGNYAQLARLAQEHGFERFDGILMDLGVSSPQLDQAERGFSFQADAPLDMRMDQTESVTAADWVNQTELHEMIRVFRSYGEERRAKRVALAIDRERRKAPIVRTEALAGLVSQALGGRRGRIHPATRVFQAIRMAVNRELEGLEEGLESAVHLLAPEGRLAVISFHSLEDRIVKQFFAAHAGREVSLQQGGGEWQGVDPRVRRITKKPVTADEEEVAGNPRARSAKLRVIERI